MTRSIGSKLHPLESEFIRVFWNHYLILTTFSTKLFVVFKENNHNLTFPHRQAKGHGFYFQHAKETCFVASKVCAYLKCYSLEILRIDWYPFLIEQALWGGYAICMLSINAPGQPEGSWKSWMRRHIFCRKTRTEPKARGSVPPNWEAVPHRWVLFLNQPLHFTGRFLEVFARRNNLRDRWVSIGNELDWRQRYYGFWYL